MRKLWNSKAARRLSCLVLALVMVLSLLPLGASAAAIGHNVTAAVAGIAKTFHEFGTTTVLFERVTLDWYAKDESIGRNQDGWWLGVRVELPEGADAQKAGFTVLRTNGEVSQRVSYLEAKDADGDAITFWSLVNEEILSNEAAGGVIYSPRYQLDWDGDGEIDQTVVSELRLNGLVLQKNGAVVYNGGAEQSYGLVEAAAAMGCQVSGNQGANVRVSYDYSPIPFLKAQEATADSTAREADGWYVTFLMHKPQDAEQPKYRKQGETEAHEFIGDTLLVSTLLATDENNAENFRDNATVWQFDWNNDGVYEQKVSLHITEAVRLLRSDFAGYPSSLAPEYSVTTRKADVMPLGGFENVTYTSEYVEGEGTTEIRMENGKPVVTFDKIGKIKITATVPDDGTFAEAQSSYTIGVVRAAQAISFAETAPKIPYDPAQAQYYAQEPQNVMGRALSYTITAQTDLDGNRLPDAQPVATIDGDGMLTILRSGKVTVRAEAAESGDYRPSSAEYTLTVIRAVDNSRLTVGAAEVNLTYGLTAYTITADASGGVITASAENAETEVRDSKVIVTFRSGVTGAVKVKITRLADEKYEAVEKEVTLNLSYAGAPNPAFTLEGEKKNDSGWFTGPVTVKAPEGWQIARGNALSGEPWADALPDYTQDGTFDAGKIHLRHENVGGEQEITDAIAVGTIRIDQTRPTELASESYKKIGEQILEIISFGWYNADVYFDLSAKDATSGVEKFEYWFADENNAEIEGTRGTIAAAKDDRQADLYTATFTVGPELKGTLRFVAIDAAGNRSDDVEGAEVILEKSAPTLAVEYSQEVSLDGAKRYYNEAAPATVTLTLTDNERLTQEDGSVDAAVTEDGKPVEVTWTPAADGKSAAATVTFSQEGVHSLTVTAKDAAGNEMAPQTTDPQIIDGTKPVCEVTYAAPQGSTDSADYYTGEFKATLQVKDVNLNPADIVVRDNETVLSLTWAQDEADPAVWTAEYTVTGEGEHLLTMTAHDRANNEMDAYASPKTLVIDETDPVISVTYGNSNVKNTVDGVSYFDRAQTATIEITETNFSAANVTLSVTAKDVTGRDIATEDFLTALRDESRWERKDGTYVATVEFPVEANYTLSVACADLSGRTAEEYGPDRFTVDATAPANLTVSYGTSLLDRVIDGITFGYYNAPVTVTLTADDAVSGVHGILYSYVKALNVSDVNAQLLDDAIAAAHIRRNGDTFTATFTIPREVLTAANQFNGTVRFTATDRSGNAAAYTDGRRTVVDTIRPTAEVTLTEPVRRDGQTAYYGGAAGVTIRINEANFYAQDVVFDVTRNGAPYAVSADWRDQSADLHTGTFSLAQEGEYVVRIRYTDRSGNAMQEYASELLIVDTTAPEITVSGVDADSANKDNPFGFVITAKDLHLDPDTLNVTLTAIVRDEDGKYATKTLRLDPAEVVKAGEEYRITVKNLTEDAVYALSCTVSDRSGNVQKSFALRDGKTYEKIGFSVNRNGSTFSVDDNTAALLEQYYTYEVGSDVVIFETNVDPVERYTVKLNDKELTEGVDYTTTLSTEPGKWALRTYTLPRSLFAAEGSYNVVVESTDKTNTVAYSDVKSLDISFVVDQTAPVLTVSGLKTGGRYQTTEQTVTVIPTDDGGRLNSFRALVLDSDGNPLRSKSGEDISVRFDLSGDELHEYLAAHDGMITFTVPEGLEHQVRLICGDSAAHADGTTNVCDERYERVTVSSNFLVIFFANKPLFYGTLAGLAVVIALVVFLIVYKKRRKK